MIQIIIISIVYEYGSCCERVNLVDNKYLKIAYQVYDYSSERIFIDFKYFTIIVYFFWLIHVQACYVAIMFQNSNDCPVIDLLNQMVFDFLGKI